MICTWIGLGLLTLLWLALVVGATRWGHDHGLARVEDGEDLDVRVCVPARDEVGKIGRCVTALAATGAREVVVIDDHSSDGTGDEARTAAGARAGITVQPGGPLAAGWSGKAWACHQAAEGARTRWLLFVDADVFVHPQAVASAIAHARQADAKLLSLFGTWDLGSPWERIVIPAVGWFIRGTIDLDRVNTAQPEAPAFANGQFILVEREAYEEWGGHGAVRDSVLDDVRMAQVARQRGHRLALRLAPWAFEVRLYRSLAEIVSGYRKNFYEGMGRRPGLALVAAGGVFATTVLPVLLVGVWLAWGDFVLAAGAGVVVGLMVLFRWRRERADGRDGSIAWLHPLAGLVLTGILLASMFSPTVRWKGRAFVGGRVVVQDEEGPHA